MAGGGPYSAGGSREKFAMSKMYRYALPVEQTKWKFNGKAETCFTWEYDDSRAGCCSSIDKGKKQQWDAKERIKIGITRSRASPGSRGRVRATNRRRTISGRATRPGRYLA